MSRALTLAVLAACLLVCSSSAKNLEKRENQPQGSNFDISNLDISNADDDSNDLLFGYDPIEPKRPEYKTQSRSGANNNNKLKSSSYTDGASEREGLDAAVMAAEPSEPKGSANVDRVKDIALNSREVRLVGPNQREVEMRDDMASKFVVAMDNLQKEASTVWGQVNEKLDKSWTDLKRSEVWGQVNDKLDKGWTDLKSMVEGVVAPSTKQQQQPAAAAERKQN